MGIQKRLLLLYSIVFACLTSVFAVFAYAISIASFQKAIDFDLLSLADQVTNRENVTTMDDGKVSIAIPSSLANFKTASTFMLILDLDGAVVARSTNLYKDHDGLLDQNFYVTEPQFSTVLADGLQLRVLTRPINEDGDPQKPLLGYIQVARIAQESGLAMLGLLMGLGAIMVTLGAFLIGALVIPNSLKPIVDIAEIAKQITDTNDLSLRIPDVFTERLDEIGTLALAFNHLLENVEENDRSKVDFIAIASHELRTPLTPVQACLQNMLNGTYGILTDKQRSRLEIALDSILEETQLIENFLDVTRLQADKVSLNLDYSSLATLLEEVVPVYKRDASEKRIELVYGLPDSDPLHLTMDVRKVKQIVTNLIDNAIKFTPENGAVAISAVRRIGFVEVYVKDTGIGIPLGEQERIFDRFYRVKYKDVHRVKGTGVGLYIVKKFVEAHGGEIRVTSIMNEGSTFTFTIPEKKG